MSAVRSASSPACAPSGGRWVGLLVGLRLPPGSWHIPPTGSRPRRCAWSPGDASAATVRSTAPRSVAPGSAPCGDRRARTSPARDVAAALGRHTRWRSPSASGRHDSTFTCHAVHRAPVASPRGAMRRSVGDRATAASEGFGRRASGLLASSRCVRARRQPGIVRPPARWAGDVRAPCAPLPRTAPCPPSRPYAVPASPPASHVARRRRAFLRRHH